MAWITLNKTNLKTFNKAWVAKHVTSSFFIIIFLQLFNLSQNIKLNY